MSSVATNLGKGSFALTRRPNFECTECKSKHTICYRTVWVLKPQLRRRYYLCQNCHTRFESDEEIIKVSANI